MARRLFDRAIKTLVVVAFTIMLGAALIGTVARYLTFLPTISWGEEVTRFAGIWSVFLVAGISVRRGAHLGVDIVTRAMAPRLRRVTAYAVLALMLGFVAVLFIYGLRIAYENLGQFSAALQWRMGVVYLCIPIGAALMALEIVIIVRRMWAGGEPPTQSIEGLAE